MLSRHWLCLTCLASSCDINTCCAEKAACLFTACQHTYHTVCPVTSNHNIRPPQSTPCTCYAHKAASFAAADSCLLPSIQDEAAKAQKRREDAASARVAALRSSDLSSYMALLQQTKNKRLQQVLAQTDSCLALIAAKLGQATQGRTAHAATGAQQWYGCRGLTK